MLQSGGGGGGGVGVHDIDTVLSPYFAYKQLSITLLHDLKDYKCGKIDKTWRNKNQNQQYSMATSYAYKPRLVYFLYLRNQTQTTLAAIIARSSERMRKDIRVFLQHVVQT